MSYSTGTWATNTGAWATNYNIIHCTVIYKTLSSNIMTKN